MEKVLTHIQEVIDTKVNLKMAKKMEKVLTPFQMVEKLLVFGKMTNFSDNNKVIYS